MSHNDTTTSLALATQLGLPHREILRAVARAGLATPSFAWWNRHFQRGRYENAAGQQRRHWIITVPAGAYLLAGHLPDSKAVRRWRRELVAAMPCVTDDAADAVRQAPMEGQACH